LTIHEEKFLISVDKIAAVCMNSILFYSQDVVAALQVRPAAATITQVEPLVAV
jgi:hypothetical protein